MAQAGRAGKGALCLGRTGILLPCPAAAASAPELLRRRKGINHRFPSSWARFAHVRAMRESLGAAIGRGVAVEVVLREPRKPSSEWRQALAALSDLDCEVRLASGGEPLDVVVIDGSLVWSGDTAPLAYPRRDDCALRFVSREVAAEFVETLTKSTV